MFFEPFKPLFLQLKRGKRKDLKKTVYCGTIVRLLASKNLNNPSFRFSKYLKIMIVMKLPMTPISPHTKVKTPSPQKSTFLIKVEFEFKVEEVWQSSSDELLLLSPPKFMVDWIIVTSFTALFIDLVYQMYITRP